MSKYEQLAVGTKVRVLNEAEHWFMRGSVVTLVKRLNGRGMVFKGFDRESGLELEQLLSNDDYEVIK